MSDVTSLRPALRLKHLYAALAALAAYLGSAFAGMWAVISSGLLLQELGLIRRTLKHFELWQAILLFLSGLVVAVVWLCVLWRMRRPLILAAKMCWYVPKAYLVWGAGACGMLGLLGMVAFFVGCAVGLGWVMGLRPHWVLPVPLWLQLATAGTGLALTGVFVATATMATKIALRIAKVDDWRASVSRSLGKIDMLAQSAPAPTEGEA